MNAPEEFPEDEADLTPEQFDALAAGGGPVQLIVPPHGPLKPGEWLTFDFCSRRVFVSMGNGAEAGDG